MTPIRTITRAKGCRCPKYGKWRGACRVKRPKFKPGELVLLTYPQEVSPNHRGMVRRVVKTWRNKATGRVWVDTRRIDVNIGGHTDPKWLSKITGKEP